MISSYFTSTSEKPLIQRVDAFLAQAQNYPKHKEVEVTIMLFSFTSDLIFERLKSMVLDSPHIQLKILADWGNISKNDHRKLHELVSFVNANFKVLFKKDQPYLWDQEQQKLRWNYNASLGLLHHKTIQLSVKGEAVKLLTGSFNWTKTAGLNYENLVCFSRNAKTAELLDAFKREFSAIWQDSKAVCSWAEGQLIKAKIKQAYQLYPAASPQVIARSVYGSKIDQDNRLRPKIMPTCQGTLQVAFSANHPFIQWRNKGFDAKNAYRYFNMHKPNGNLQRVPIDIHTVALDLIYKAKPGELLCLCMYAISPRVPEYNALLTAARRGVQIHCILDRTTNRGMLEKLNEVTVQENLPIQLKSGTRPMHQKYLLHIHSNTVVTGTANMSTDSSLRHLEHRIWINEQPEVAKEFNKDFEVIWSRLAQYNQTK